VLFNDTDLKFLVQRIDLKLKHVSAMGVYGWNSICETVVAEWLEDISKNLVFVFPCMPVTLNMYAFVSTNRIHKNLIQATPENKELNFFNSPCGGAFINIVARSKQKHYVCTDC
jgi:hypothetical protein